MRLIDADELIASLKPEESVWVGLVLAEQVANAPTVKAIPIEWINEHSGDYFISGTEQFHLSEMLDAWEKENGRSE